MMDAKAMRQVLGHFATGVVVVSADGPSDPVGMVANSFTSVSLDPPMVLFCAGRDSTTWPSIRMHGRFCVNILRHDQEELARRFAAKDVDRFEGVTYCRGPSGSPVLDGALAYVDCEIEREHPAGDHVIVVGRVLELDVVGDEVGWSAPLVFFRGQYRHLS
jgi:flavin reductase (DIM6/NTAB) family NADH-FMN oxidoreductase RutF